MSRPPPESKRDKFVRLALEIANDNSHGYSQKPPNGRWGPDYDCASLIYFLANSAGYDVGIGSDKVRFTGTMLKDFEKAGFQILPFANVGISDLKLGAILLNLALHADVYVGNGETVSANSDENGGYIGKESGDQTGREIEKHSVLTFDGDWDYILRPPNEEDSDEVEGDTKMPINYNTPMPTANGNMNGSNMPVGYNTPMTTTGGNMNGNGWPQGNMMPYNQPNNYRGYPQGNLGQMNGYSQANAGGYPQPSMMGMNQPQPMQNMGNPQGYSQQMPNDLSFVMGIEGAKNTTGAPNSRVARFDEDKPLMYICSYDQNGSCNGINVYKFEECSEEMPQHLSPLMHNGYNSMPQQQMGLTKEDVMKIIEEMIGNDSTASSANANGQPNAQSANGARNGRTS